VVFSLCASGVALLIAVFAFAVLMHELLLVTGWPPPEQTAAMFFFIGPLGQGAAALLYLGDAVEKSADQAGGGNRGSLPAPAVVQSVNVLCILLALFLIGMAAIWLILGFMVVVFRLSRRELEWNPTWNGIVFPVTTMGIATAQFSIVFHSRFLGILTCSLLIFSAILFIVNFGFTVVHLLGGRLLVVREDRRLASRVDQNEKSH